MKIENFKEKLTARCEKEYNAQPKELTPEPAPLCGFRACYGGAVPGVGEEPRGS